MSATQNPSVTPSGPVLEVTDLNVDFGVDNVWVPAARHVTYSVEPGEVLAIVGESGSGKSVSSMAIFGLLPSNARGAGECEPPGSRAHRAQAPRPPAHPRASDLDDLPGAHDGVEPVLTVGAQIVETLRQHFGIAPSAAKERAIELLGMVELPDPQKAFASYPHQLSGGQRQRAMIAQSISCDPSSSSPTSRRRRSM